MTAHPPEKKTSRPPESRRPPLPHRGRAWVLGVILPVLITAASWLVVLLWAPRLPDEVAMHWGPGGEVDQTGSVGELLAVPAVLGGVSLLVLAVLSLTTGRQALTRRMVLGLAMGMATLFAGGLLASVGIQLDSAGPAQMGSPAMPIGLTVLAALALGVLGGMLAGSDPAQPTTAPVDAAAPRATLGAQERAVWTHQVGAGSAPAMWVGLAVLVIVSIGSSLLADSWWIAASMAPVAVLMAGFLVWRVRVDARGLTATGALGFPRVHVPADEVERADVVEVSPLGEFGGWGLRTNLEGTVGVVIRSGEAIAVQRSGGRRLVVTVDDAATGAALLNTFADRARTATNTNRPSQPPVDDR